VNKVIEGTPSENPTVLSPSKNDKEKPPQQRNFAPLSIKDMLVHFVGYEEVFQPRPFGKEKEVGHFRAC
jgi:hypothetical protein